MRSLRSAAPLILAVLVAAILRTDQLLDQIPVGDEWHALQVVSTLDCSWIFTHFGGADYCIPLALYYELVADAAGLGEVAFRLPSLIAGLALVVLVPLLVRDIVGKPAADALAFLLAVSPMLVYYSRWARPYAIALLLALVGTLALWRWRLGAGNRWAWGYGACAVLGGWFLPPFIPFLFAPLAFLLGERLVRPGTGRSPWVVLGLAAGVLAGAALLLLPPWVVDAHNLKFKLGRSAIELPTLEQAFKFYAGTHRAGLLLGVGALAAAGIAMALRRSGAFCSYLGFILGCQGLALALARPEMIGSGAIFGRYMLPALVVLLLFVAVALGELDRIARSHATPLFAAIGALVLFSYGPLPAIHTRPNNWTSHPDFQDTYDPAIRVWRYEEWGRRRKRLPALYEDLGAREPGSLLIVEAPWYLDHVPFHIYQRTHRQRMCIGFVGRGSNLGNELPLDDGRFSFQSFVDVGDHESVVERGVDYVIFHRNLKRELRHNDRLERVPVYDHLLAYRRRFGAPVFEDKEIVVFEVAERAPGSGSRPAAAGGAEEGDPP